MTETKKEQVYTEQAVWDALGISADKDDWGTIRDDAKKELEDAENHFIYWDMKSCLLDLLMDERDLLEYYRENDVRFIRYFRSLRDAIGPKLKDDTVVLGTYLRQMVLNPTHAGGIVADLIARDRKAE